MTARQHKTSSAGKKPSEKGEAMEGRAQPGGEDECRCKEVAKKTPFEMLKLMISDFAFWKKSKK